MVKEVANMAQASLPPEQPAKVAPFSDGNQL